MPQKKVAPRAKSPVKRTAKSTENFVNNFYKEIVPAYISGNFLDSDSLKEYILETFDRHLSNWETFLDSFGEDLRSNFILNIKSDYSSLDGAIKSAIEGSLFLIADPILNLLPDALKSVNSIINEIESLVENYAVEYFLLNKDAEIKTKEYYNELEDTIGEQDQESKYIGTDFENAPQFNWRTSDPIKFNKQGLTDVLVDDGNGREPLSRSELNQSVSDSDFILMFAREKKDFPAGTSLYDLLSYVQSKTKWSPMVVVNFRLVKDGDNIKLIPE